MSAEQNPQNYTGVTATVIGRTAGPAENPAYDKQGARGYQQVRIAVDQGYKDSSGQWVETGTLWVTHTAPADILASVGKGDKVRIDDARLEAREFTRKDGTTGQAFETRFGDFTILESKAGDTEEAPF